MMNSVNTSALQHTLSNCRPSFFYSTTFTSSDFWNHKMKMYNPHCHWRIGSVILLYSSLCNAALTYWIDSTCPSVVGVTIKNIVDTCTIMNNNMGTQPLAPHLNVAFEKLFDNTDATTQKTVKGTVRMN